MYMDADVSELLRARGVPAAAIELVEHAVPIIERVCERAVADYDPGAEGDDRTLLGLVCARRSRNLIAAETYGTLPAVAIRWPRGALELTAGGCRVYFYAGAGDDAAPKLRGGATKKELLSEFEQLSLIPRDTDGPPSALLVAYRASVPGRGLVRAVIGVPDGAESWAWSETLYARSGHDVAPVTPMPAEFDRKAVPAPMLRLVRPERDEQQDEQ
jgi:hypothetical protein